jgi:hypothetical protein
MKHLHHIIPKHAGGSDDPSNLIELTPEEHANAHLELYHQYGRPQDLWAASILFQDGRIDMSGKNNPMYGKSPWNKGLTKEQNPSLSGNGQGGFRPNSGRKSGKEFGSPPWNAGKSGYSLKSKGVSKPQSYVSCLKCKKTRALNQFSRFCINLGCCVTSK